MLQVGKVLLLVRVLVLISADVIDFVVVLLREVGLACAWNVSKLFLVSEDLLVHVLDSVGSLDFGVMLVLVAVDMLDVGVVLVLLLVLCSIST